MNSPEAQARQRALLILQVQAGQITATEAAQHLGVSRKTYYQWEKRALAALLQATEQQPPGRPPKEADPEKDQLRRQVTQLEQKVNELEQVMELRQLVHQFQGPDLDTKKNSRSCTPASTKPPPPNPAPDGARGGSVPGSG
jgi:transposase